MKVISIIFIFLGESLAIYSEIMAAKKIDRFLSVFWQMILVMFLASVFLILGYILGAKYLGNIWIVGVISIASIVVMEPLVIYMIFQELPTKGPLIGLIFGVMGIIFALFV